MGRQPMAVLKKRNSFKLRKEKFLFCVQQEVFSQARLTGSTEICTGFEHLIFPVKTFFPLKRKL